MSNKHKRIQRRLKEQKHLAKVEEKLKYETTDMLMLMPLYVLHEYFGFGQQRGQKFLIEFQKIFSAIAAGDVNIKTLAAVLDNDIGMKYEIATGVWEITKPINKGRKRNK